MPLTLIDDGTLDTVFSCSECGHQIRYSAEWSDTFYGGGDEEEDDESADFEGSLQDLQERMLAVATEEHAEECLGSPPQDPVLCQVRIRREDYEGAREYFGRGERVIPVIGVTEIIRHPNSDEDGPFLRWLRSTAEGERQPDLVEWFMTLVKGEQTIADLRQVYEDGEFEEEETEEG